MPQIELETTINAPIEKVFDLSLSVDLHKLSAEKSKEQAIEGKISGMLKLGESVTWRAKHFGLWLKHTSRITEYEKPNYFVDEMTEGSFKSFRHEHRFRKKGSNTVMTDILQFKSPLGILGKLFDKIILTAYLRQFLIQRNQIIKLESEKTDFKIID